MTARPHQQATGQQKTHPEAQRCHPRQAALLERFIRLMEVQKMKSLKNAVARFVREEDGAQVVEYGLIVAVVSLALIIALATLTDAEGGPFDAMVTRVGTCLSSGVCT